MLEPTYRRGTRRARPEKQRLEIPWRPDALDVQPRKADERFGKRAARQRAWPRLHLDKPIPGSATRLESGSDVLRPERGHTRADDEDRAFERHGADARQMTRLARDLHRRILVDEEQPARDPATDRLAAMNGRGTWRQRKGRKTQRRDRHSFFTPVKALTCY